MIEVNFILPKEENGYNFFSKEYELNSTIAFHCTPIRNLQSICNEGFKSAQKLTNNSLDLSSISFSKNSSGCLVYMGKPVKEGFCVFAVQFDSNHPSLDTTDQYIRIDDNSVQPIILSYCLVVEGTNYF